jgi:hypothetical protein
MIYAKTARQLAYSWHSGQSSPLYAAASSGLVADWTALLDEVNGIEDTADRTRLREFFKSWQYRAPRKGVAGAICSILPWGA